MKIGVNYSIGYKQPAFQAVNQEYFKKAHQLYEKRGNITADWIESLTDDVVLFGDISKKDAIDTMNAVRKYVSKESMDVFESTFKFIKNA